MVGKFLSCSLLPAWFFETNLNWCQVTHSKPAGSYRRFSDVFLKHYWAKTKAKLGKPTLREKLVALQLQNASWTFHRLFLQSWKLVSEGGWSWENSYTLMQLWIPWSFENGEKIIPQHECDMLVNWIESLKLHCWSWYGKIIVDGMGKQT